MLPGSSFRRESRASPDAATPPPDFSEEPHPPAMPPGGRVLIPEDTAMATVCGALSHCGLSHGRPQTARAGLLSLGQHGLGVHKNDPVHSKHPVSTRHCCAWPLCPGAHGHAGLSQRTGVRSCHLGEASISGVHALSHAGLVESDQLRPERHPESQGEAWLTPVDPILPPAHPNSLPSLPVPT